MMRFSWGIICQVAIGFAGIVLTVLILGAVWRHGTSLLQEVLGEWLHQRPAFGPIQLLPRLTWLRLGRVR
ncbi:hypothetical protein HYZ80_01535 [Candidatus Parcubacteria bacterium]|nr:hypothetical protein [Candidatus Parcubacteria bacterium]